MLKVLVIITIALTGFAIAEPLIYEAIFDKHASSGQLDSAALFAAIVGLMALIGTIIGFVVRDIVERAATEQSGRESRRQAALTTADALLEVSLFAWDDYWLLTRGPIEPEHKGFENSKDPRRWPEIRNGLEEGLRHGPELRLNSAIELVRHGHRRSRFFGGDRLDNETRLHVANSLLYYIAERSNTDDKFEAQTLAKDLRASYDDFPDYAPRWGDTIEHARSAWPNTDLG